MQIFPRGGYHRYSKQTSTKKWIKVEQQISIIDKVLGVTPVKLNDFVFNVTVWLFNLIKRQNWMSMVILFAFFLFWLIIELLCPVDFTYIFRHCSCWITMVLERRASLNQGETTFSNATSLFPRKVSILITETKIH